MSSIARRRHGDGVVDRFVRSLGARRRLNEIVAKRNALTKPEHRFLLGVLLNVTDTAIMMDLFRQRYPDHEPVDMFLECVQELSTTKVLGDPGPNVLGIADYDVEHSIVVGRLLRGGSFQAAVEDLTAALADEPPRQVDRVADQIVRDLSQSLLLSRLLTDCLPPVAAGPASPAAHGPPASAESG